jgi:hypothetical protein
MQASIQSIRTELRSLRCKHRYGGILPSLRRLEPGHRPHTVPLLRLRPLPTVLLQKLPLLGRALPRPLGSLPRQGALRRRWDEQPVRSASLLGLFSSPCSTAVAPARPPPNSPAHSGADRPSVLITTPSITTISTPRHAKDRLVRGTASGGARIAGVGDARGENLPYQLARSGGRGKCVRMKGCRACPAPSPRRERQVQSRRSPHEHGHGRADTARLPAAYAQLRTSILQNVFRASASAHPAPPPGGAGARPRVRFHAPQDASRFPLSRPEALRSCLPARLLPHFRVPFRRVPWMAARLL